MTLVSTGAAGAVAGPIFLDAPAANTIASFLASGPITPNNCASGPTCGDIILSSSGFLSQTLFEFQFTAPTAGSLVIDHDDGVSLFVDSGTGNSPGPTNLLNPDDAKPTTPANTEPVNLTAGTVYDLFYTSANNLPEVLHTDFEPTPAPLIGHGLLALLAVGGVLFGGKLLETFKARRLHAA
jgi:hypothetical protein